MQGFLEEEGADGHHGDHGEEEQGQLPTVQERLHDGEDEGGDEEAEHPDLLADALLQLVQVLGHLGGKGAGGAGVVPRHILSQN